MASGSFLRNVRLIHLYSGVFLAPAILFFAFTGGVQMFGLHETSRGSSYTPPALLVHLAQLHKKGTLYLPQRKAPPALATPAPSAPGARTEAPRPSQAAPTPPPHNPLPIKIFFGLTAFGLIISTLSGLVMAWRYTRRKSVVATIFVAGVLVPLLLLLL